MEGCEMNIDQIVGRLRETGCHVGEDGEKALRKVLAEVGATQETAQGVPLWDWYAGQALNGILAGPDADPHWDYTALAVDHANKMMKARKGSQ
jgi:hypothetical protein